MYLINRWADAFIGLASGGFAFWTYQNKHVPQERRLEALLGRGYDLDVQRQKDKRAAEAELEREATDEISKLFASEQLNSTPARS